MTNLEALLKVFPDTVLDETGTLYGKCPSDLGLANCLGDRCSLSTPGRCLECWSDTYTGDAFKEPGQGKACEGGSNPQSSPEEFEELKPCPFCGVAPRVEKSGGRTGSRGDEFDFEISWRAICPKCGTAKGPYRDRYVVKPEGSLQLKEGFFTDGYRKVVQEWNKRGE